MSRVGLVSLWVSMCVVAVCLVVSPVLAVPPPPGSIITTDLILDGNVDATGHTGPVYTIGASGVTIDGQSLYSIIAPDASSAIYSVGHDDVTVRNLQILTQESPGSPTRNAIRIGTADGVTLENVTVTNTTATPTTHTVRGVYVDYCANVVVRDCDFSGTTAGFLSYYSAPVTLESNVMEDCFAGGITLRNTAGVLTVLANQLSRSKRGLHAVLDDGATLIARDNIATDCTSQAISVIGDVAATIDDNDCRRSPTGISCSLGTIGTATIEGNNCAGSGSGIVVNGGSPATVIANNDFTGAGYGLRLEGTAAEADFFSESILNGSKFSGCRLAVAVTDPPPGLTYSSSNIDFSAFTGIWGYTLYIAGAEQVTVKHVRTGTGVRGLWITNCTDVTVRDCDLSGDTQETIECAVLSHCSGITTFQNNTVREGKTGLGITAAEGTVLIGDNDFSDNVRWGVSCKLVAGAEAEIRNNNCSSCGWPAIYLEGGKSVVEKNDCQGSGAGIDCQLTADGEVVLRNNNCSGSSVGIRMYGGTLASLIEANNLSNTSGGLDLYGSACKIDFWGQPNLNDNNFEACGAAVALHDPVGITYSDMDFSVFGAIGTAISVGGGQDVTFERVTSAATQWNMWITDCPNVRLSECVLTGAQDGLVTQSCSGVVLRGCSIAGNTRYGINNRVLEPAYLVDAGYNWWGHPTGPYDPNGPSPDGIGPHLGLGDAVTNYVLYDPWLEAPQITVVGLADPVPVGTLADFVATFSIAPTDGTWYWGDGQSDPLTLTSPPPTPPSATAAHAYATPGVYTVTVVANYAEAGFTAEGTFQYVVVYDPTGGFVTGGGWITSPVGAYVPDLDLTGKANFGFVAKYKKGADVPTGNTQFQFKVADLNFHSSEYEWLVVAGHKAKYKGTGAINGAGNYGFMLTAIDGDLKDNGTPDEFRIKIWDRTSGDGVVYDNKMNAPDDGEDATELGGGSIVIHKGDANSNTRSAIAGSGARIAGLAAVPTRGGGAEIAFTLSADANITATVLNVAGRRVRTIGANVAATRGANSVLWDGRNEHATRAPAGIYLIRLTSKTGEGRVNNSTTLLRIGR